MANEKRLIDAKRVPDALLLQFPQINIPLVQMALDNISTVDAVEVVHGRWIKDGEVLVCSECGEEHAWDEYRASYCEDCGAKMDGDANGMQ